MALHEDSRAGGVREGRRVNSAASLKTVLGATLAACIGIGFFFTIIGVFGLSAAIIAIVIFVLLATFIIAKSKQQSIS